MGAITATKTSNKTRPFQFMAISIWQIQQMDQIMPDMYYGIAPISTQPIDRSVGCACRLTLSLHLFLSCDKLSANISYQAIW
jgi:hypothetical protein